MRNAARGSTLPPIEWLEPLPEVISERELMPWEVAEIQAQAGVYGIELSVDAPAGAGHVTRHWRPYPAVAAIDVSKLTPLLD